MRVVGQGYDLPALVAGDLSLRVHSPRDGVETYGLFFGLDGLTLLADPLPDLLFCGHLLDNQEHGGVLTSRCRHAHEDTDILVDARAVVDPGPSSGSQNGGSVVADNH